LRTRVGFAANIALSSPWWWAPPDLNRYVDCYERPALPLSQTPELVRMAGLEPAVSRARGVRFGRAKLHPGIGAHDEDRTRLPGSTVRSLRQVGTWAIGWAIGALGRNRTGMVSRRPLKTARLPVSPRARIELEDLVGLEPTVTLRQRIKNPLPWPLGAQVRDGGSGWFRTTSHGLKIRSISIQV
jgi:hypothetical protein